MSARRVRCSAAAFIATGGALLGLSARAVRAQQGAPPASTHLLRFFLAEQGSADPPSAVEPSRVPMLRKRIALDLDSVPVHAALQKLSRLSGLRFIYADDVVDADRV
ncbi:MAG: hypothetical protein ACHQSE_14290, partial [Gemmatimonadales bacterium]